MPEDSQSIVTSRATLTPPKVGAPWPGQGGIYAGVIRGANGGPDHYLIVAEEEEGAIAWKKAGAWAAALAVAGQRDFALPTRCELRILMGNVPELFERAWYWSSEQYADDAGYAWCQSFGLGGQSNSHKRDELRARAVRRLVI